MSRLSFKAVIHVLIDDFNNEIKVFKLTVSWRFSAASLSLQNIASSPTPEIELLPMMSLRIKRERNCSFFICTYSEKIEHLFKSVSNWKNVTLIRISTWNSRESSSPEFSFVGPELSNFSHLEGDGLLRPDRIKVEKPLDHAQTVGSTHLQKDDWK